MEGGSSPIGSSGEFEEQLRGRLRVMLAVWGGVVFTVSVASMLKNLDLFRADPRQLVTLPPLPGVLFVVGLATAYVIRMLRPGRHLGLRRLRAVEWFSVAMLAGFCVLNQTLTLFAGTAFDIRENSMDLGAGLGAPWGAAVVLLGAFAPSGARHCLVRTAVLATCAFIPELVAFPGTIGLSWGAAPYLAIKIATVGSMSSLAVFDAYRMGALRKDVRDARQLGSYVLRRLLGTGGMGEVYLAEHQFLRRSCAVKLIRPEQAGNEETLARFEREVRAAARLTHPNTVQIFDYGRAEDGTFYYAMEYLPGITLEELVDRYGPIPPARTVCLLVQLCGALREAHACGLIHRDLKPGNIMVCERGGEYDVVKVLDYGLVVAAGSNDTDPRLTQVGMVLGTPAFMSPEQCGGDAKVTAASDIYSVGAVSYFMLTGKAPFAGRGPVQMMAAHLYETPKPVSDVRTDTPEALSRVVARCLEKTPSARFADTETLEQELLASMRNVAWTARDARAWWASREEAAPVAVTR